MEVTGRVTVTRHSFGSETPIFVVDRIFERHLVTFVTTEPLSPSRRTPPVTYERLQDITQV